MKNKIGFLLLLFVFVQNVISQTYQWPVYPTNAQGNIAGTVGEYRPIRFHMGVDITSSSVNASFYHNVYAINSGLVTVVPSGNNSYLQIGTIQYIHVEPAGAVLAAYNAGRNAYVNVGDLIGTMVIQTNIHLHLQEATTNFIAQHLSPFIDNAAPTFSSNYITNGVRFYRNSIVRSTPVANLPNLLLNQTQIINGTQHTILYNKVDIAVHAIEPQTSSNGASNGGQCSPTRIAWVLRNSNNQDLITNNDFDFTTIPVNDANHTGACFHPQSAGLSAPTIQIITSSPNQATFDRYFNTGLRANTTDTWPNNNTLDALSNAAAQYPDGTYQLIINASDVSFANNPQVPTSRTENILLDNFRPYIEKVEVRKNNSTGTLFYEGHWTWDGSGLVFSCQSPVAITSSDIVYVKIYASEPMREVEVTAFGSTLNYTRVGTNNQQWEHTYPASSSNVGSKKIITTYNSHDLAGNRLSGFATNARVTSIPVRQSNGIWSPVPIPDNDQVHTLSATSSKAQIGFWDIVKNAYIDYAKFIILSTKLQMKLIPLGMPMYKSASVDGSELWTITDPDGIKTSYTQGDFEYVFSKLGTYTVSVSVQNGSGTDEDVKTITVTDGTTPNFTQTASGQNSLTINFSDQSASPENIDSWYWDFGDSYTSNEQNPSHTYSQAGNYLVTLRITNNVSQAKEIQKTIYVEDRPGMQVDFYLGNNPGAYSIQPNTIAQFISKVTNAAGGCTYQWDFGDGTAVSSSPFPIHTYSTSGNYTASLTVTDNNVSRTVSHPIRVSQIGAINASFTASASNKTATFTVTSNQYVTAYLYFGDGCSSTPFSVDPNFPQTLTHTYSYTNNYDAILYVNYNGQWVNAFSEEVSLPGTPAKPLIMINLHDCLPVNKPWVAANIVDITPWYPNRGTVSSNSPSEIERNKPYYYECQWRAVYNNTTLNNFFSHGIEPYQYLNINDPAVQNCFSRNEPFKCMVYLDVYDGSSPLKVYQTSREVILYPPVKIDLSNSYQACSNTSLEFLPNITGGMPPYEYTWINSSGNPESFDPSKIILVGSQSNTYKLLIRDGRSGMSGCYNYGEKSFTIQPSPVTVEAGNTINVCGLNAVGSISPVISGGAGQNSYLWTPSLGLNSNTISNPYMSSSQKGSQIYTLTVTDKYGCTGSDQVQVNFNEVPRIDMVTDVSINYGQTKTITPVIFGGSGNYNFLWSNGETSQNITVGETSPLSLTLTVKDNISGCTSQATVNVLTKFNTITSQNNFRYGRRAYNTSIPVKCTPSKIRYRAHSDCPWVTITSGSSGISEDKIVISVAANPYGTTRNGKLIIESSGALNSPFEINLTQTGEDLPIQVPSAYISIQEAINEAVNGDRIEVDEGQYYENLIFSGSKKISIKSTGCPENTILSPATNSQPIVSYTNSNSSILQGFTITGNNLSATYDDGSGIFISQSSPELYDLIIKNNITNYGAGGGIYISAGSYPKLVNLKILQNLADEGGGIYSLGNPTLQNVLIAENRVIGTPGNDRANGTGGGLHSYGNITMDNVTISNNIYPTGFDRCGGLTVSGGTITLNSCIVTDQIGSYGTSSLNTFRSDIPLSIKGTTTTRWGIGSIALDPKLDNSYHLMTGSPCINNGNPTRPDKDGSINDMGFTGGKGIYDNVVQVCTKGMTINPTPGYLQIAGSCSMTYLSEESANYLATRQIILGNGFTASHGSNLTFKIQPYYNEPFQYDDRCQSLKKGTISFDINREYFDNNSSDLGFDFVIYPNPTTDKVRLELKQTFNLESKIEIIDLSGKVLEKFHAFGEIVDLDFSKYAVGLYFIKMFNGNNIKAKLIHKI